MRGEYIVKLRNQGIIKDTKGTKTQASIALRRIYAGYLGKRRIPKKVPPRFGMVVKINSENYIKKHMRVR